MTKRLIIACIAVGVFLAALSAFHFLVKPAMIKSFMAANVPPPAAVAAEPVTAEDWIPQRHSIGTLIAVQGVDIASQVGGVVSAIQFNSGDRVVEGAQLIRLDDDVEQADLLSNRATLREAILEFKRQKDLMDRGFAAEAKMEEARRQQDAASASVQRMRAVIAQKTIEAPFAGRLGLKQVEIGQYVSPGQALVTLQSLDPIRVDYPVPEKEIGLMKEGQSIELRVDAYPGEVFKGKIETLDARVDRETRTLTVRGKVANPDEKLLPGMFANVSVLAGTPKRSLFVPRTAVTFSLYGNSVYVAKEEETKGEGKNAGDGKSEASLVAERRFVKTGETRDGRIEVLEGVKEGELVVTTGQLKLKPGSRIQVSNEAPLKAADERPKQ